jgi:glyoxylase-like metal-dependent hydrolase (beta-lactamase superfamily II)
MASSTAAKPQWRRAIGTWHDVRPMTDLLLDGRDDLHLGAVTVLTGVDKGRYPHGNSLLVRGPDLTLLVDPSVSLAHRVDGPTPAPVDVVFNSHAHEDHIGGNHLFGAVPLYIHEADRPGLLSIEGFLGIYGLEDDSASADWGETVVAEFNYRPRPDAIGLEDGHRFDLGGGIGAEIVHLPGHTRGHSGVMVPDAGVCFVGDVDLSGFGPYYGDAWSSLEDFKTTLELCRELDATWFVTFHHKHVVEGRDVFLGELARFTEVIARRDEELLAYLAEPHTLDDIVAHRFVYRPHVEAPYIDSAERRSMSQHVDGLLAAGKVVEVEPGRYRAG